MPYFSIMFVIYEIGHSLFKYVQFFSKNALKLVAIHASLLILKFTQKEKEKSEEKPLCWG